MTLFQCWGTLPAPEFGGAHWPLAVGATHRAKPDRIEGHSGLAAGPTGSGDAELAESAEWHNLGDGDAHAQLAVRWRDIVRDSVRLDQSAADDCLEHCRLVVLDANVELRHNILLAYRRHEQRREHERADLAVYNRTTADRAS